MHVEMEGELLSEEEIISMKEPFETIPGIYFLIKDNNIVYIGQSIHIPARVRSHAIPGRKSVHLKKEFDSYTYVMCREEELDFYERAYIQKFKPIYNGTYNKR